MHDGCQWQAAAEEWGRGFAAVLLNFLTVYTYLCSNGIDVEQTDIHRSGVSALLVVVAKVVADDSGCTHHTHDVSCRDAFGEGAVVVVAIVIHYFVQANTTGFE